MPVTTTRPRHSNSVRAAARNAAPSLSDSAPIAAASVVSTSRPSASARFASTPRAVGGLATIVADMQQSIPEGTPAPRIGGFLGTYVLDSSHVAYAGADPAASGGGRRRHRRLPARAPAADSGLPRGRDRGRPPRNGLGARQRRRARSGRVRDRLPDVFDRSGVQPAAAEGDAARGIRPGGRAGCDHDADGDDGPAPAGLLLSCRGCAWRRAGAG